MVSATEAQVDEELQSWLISVLAAMVILSTVAFTLRIVSRRLESQSLWWDDGLILISTLMNIVYVALAFALNTNKLGLPMRLGSGARPAIGGLLITTQVLYVWNTCLTKTSVLLMYNRFFCRNMEHTRYVTGLFLLGGIVLAWTVVTSSLIIFRCVPVHKFWNPYLPGRCLSFQTVWIVSTAATMSSDLLILLFSIPLLCRKKLDFAEKMWMPVLFAMGFFAIFASLYRHATLLAWSARGNTILTLTPAVGWTEVEIAAGIIAACLPILGPLLPTSILPREPVRRLPRTRTQRPGAPRRATPHPWARRRRSGPVVVQARSNSNSSNNNNNNNKRFSSHSGATTSRRRPATPEEGPSGERWPQEQVEGEKPMHHHREDQGHRHTITATDVMDWECSLEEVVRAQELCVSQREALAAPVAAPEAVALPSQGINVTKNFWRWDEEDGNGGEGSSHDAG